ncbi:MAG: hypothetical protein COZ23_02035 [Hydrogenophilales bacterium CG_4_10_14_3_um_filter_58_23]|nr:MAG: hypothetical protein COZ23_02035 [Hydrogenophilales bacterium CG_4_10_14_3_um_filter_58_23]
MAHNAISHIENHRHKPALRAFCSSNLLARLIGRIEPRAVKRRPKPYPLLTKTRILAREQLRKYGPPKKT